MRGFWCSVIVKKMEMIVEGFGGRLFGRSMREKGEFLSSLKSKYI